MDEAKERAQSGPVPKRLTLAPVSSDDQEEAESPEAQE